MLPDNAIIRSDGSIIVNDITFIDIDDYFDYIA